MAKKSMVARDVKRVQTASKYAAKRAALKAIIDDRNASMEQVVNYRRCHAMPAPPASSSGVG